MTTTPKRTRWNIQTTAKMKTNFQVRILQPGELLEVQ